MKKYTYLVPKLFTLAWVSSFALYCGNSSPTISVPDLRPPVQASLSSALISGGSYAQPISAKLEAGEQSIQAAVATCETNCSASSNTDAKKVACEARHRFFCTAAGPSEILSLIATVDNRLAEVESRSTGDVSCMGNGLTDSTNDSGVVFPGSATFNHSLQCKDSSIATAWGQDTSTNTWYMRGAQGAMAFVAKIINETNVEGYFWLPSSNYSFDSSTGLLHLKANKTNKTYEMTGGGHGIGFCGFHMMSNETHIYIYGNRFDESKCDRDGDNDVDADDWHEACLTSDFEYSDGNDGSNLTACGSIDKDNFTLTTLYRGQTKNASGSDQAASNADNYGPAGTPATTNKASFDMGKELNDLYSATGSFSSSVAEFTVD